MSDKTVHVVIMSKGGVGKTLIAWNLVQYLRERSTVSAIDLDPLSHSLAEYAGLGARSVDLLTGPDLMFNGPEVDKLMDELILDDKTAHSVLDNGAAGFTGLIRYLVDHDFASMLESHCGGRLVIHAVLAGGSAATQCLMGLDTLLREFSSPSVKFVGWINAHEGAFELIDPDKKAAVQLENMAIYRSHQERFLGLVTLPKLSAFFAVDLKVAQTKHLTYEEAITSPDTYLMNKQRLAIIRKQLWTQLDQLELI